MIVLKGYGHPDVVATNLAEVAINALYEYNPDLYGNFDKSYIKSSRFPEFVVAGDLSFDFKEYDIEYRHEMEAFITDKIKEKFRILFPNCAMNVSFNLGLFPSSKQGTTDEVHDRTCVYNNDRDTESILPLLQLEERANEFEFSGRDLDITQSADVYVINQTFLGDGDSSYDDIYNMFVEHMGKKFDGKKLVINPIEKPMNRFGSRLFTNLSGKCGGERMRDYRTIESDSIFGTHPKSSIRKLSYESSNDEVATLYSIEGQPKSTIHKL